MPRDGSGVYSQPFPNVVAGTEIESAVYNGFTNDVVIDLNAARPLVAGGTGATSAAAALFNVSGEKATQVVTDYGTQVWVPGSFRSAAGATGAPNATAIFSGVCYIHEALANPPTNQNVTVEARDVSDGVLYIRTKTAGTWSAWKTERANSYAAPFDAMAYNGMQINGSMEVSQENGINAVIVVGADKYVVDGLRVVSVGTQSMTCGQVGAAPSGYTVSVQVQATIANASPAAGHYCFYIQKFEGYRVSRLAWGTASAQPITIAFWMYSPRIGTYSGVVRNTLQNRNYPFTFTVNVTNTWEFKTVTIPGDTTGTWAKDNTSGMEVLITIMCGTTNQQPAGAWTSSVAYGATGTINGVQATNDYTLITGLVVLPGIEAPSAARSPLIMRPYDQELLTCRRYFYGTAGGVGVAPVRGIVSAANIANYMGAPHPVQMRTGPTLTIVSPLPVYDGSVFNTLTSIKDNLSTPNTLEFNAYSGAGTLTANRPAIVYQFSGGNLTVDARL